MTTELPEWRCRKCGENPIGPGGIICPECRTAIEARVYPVPPPAPAAKQLGGKDDAAFTRLAEAVRRVVSGYEPLDDFEPEIGGTGGIGGRG